ncbi:TRADD-N-associated membrane domain-containing protein [Scytonema sp. NUACC26]|uniref:TRADD-N-associated membrane domain-containing protein n=1 Tax=Scytonema sp. NUACC26 TaxID=3140176 RepID=UPI0034DBBF4B
MQHSPQLPGSNSVEASVAQERLRQARLSFNLALVATAVSTFISLVGAALLLTLRANEGAVTAASGMVACVRCVQLAKDANDRLDRIGQGKSETT